MLHMKMMIMMEISCVKISLKKKELHRIVKKKKPHKQRHLPDCLLHRIFRIDTIKQRAHEFGLYSSLSSSVLCGCSRSVLHNSAGGDVVEWRWQKSCFVLFFSGRGGGLSLKYYCVEPDNSTQSFWCFVSILYCILLCFLPELHPTHSKA